MDFSFESPGKRSKPRLIIIIIIIRAPQVFSVLKNAKNAKPRCRLDAFQNPKRITNSAEKSSKRPESFLLWNKSPPVSSTKPSGTGSRIKSGKLMFVGNLGICWFSQEWRTHIHIEQQTCVTLISLLSLSSVHPPLCNLNFFFF